MEVENSQQMDATLSAARTHRIGHAIGFGAGPWTLDKLYNITVYLPHPIDGDNVNTIFKLLASGEKHDWQHPIIAQITTSQFTVESLDKIQASNSLAAQSPLPLLASTHSQELLQLLGALWTETDPSTGRYLSRSELQAIQAQYNTQKGLLPTLVLLQGAHRWEALKRFAEKIEVHRVNMVSLGQKGDQHGFNEERERIQDLILQSSFLISLYPSKPHIPAIQASAHTLQIPCRWRKLVFSH